MNAPAAPRGPRIHIVVVLYRMLPTESEAVRGIAEALDATPELRNAYTLLLWDNTPDTGPPPDLAGVNIPCQYRRSTVNHGVAGAFNGAAAHCRREGHEWMLLFDQDTRVTAAYLAGILRHYQRVMHDAKIAAIVPKLIAGGSENHVFQISPQQVLPFRQRPVAAGPPRILEAEIFAANSGVLMRVAALEAIGGYSLDFWLDHSDMYVFHQFFLREMTVFYASDLQLEHSMTMLDYDTRMTPARYENFLFAEQAFLDLYKSRIENLVQVLRLAARSLRQRKYRSKQYAQMTLRFLRYRLVTSQTVRLVAWRARAAARSHAQEQA